MTRSKTDALMDGYKISLYLANYHLFCLAVGEDEWAAEMKVKEGGRIYKETVAETICIREENPEHRDYIDSLIRSFWDEGLIDDGLIMEDSYNENDDDYYD